MVKQSLLALCLIVISASAADAQILTATATIVNGTGANIKNMKGDGTISVQAGQSLSEVKNELGTITNGVFTAGVGGNPPMTYEKTLNPVLVNNAATFSHHFLNPALAVGTYAIKVTAKVTKPGPFGIPTNVTVAPAYATATVN